MAVTQTSNFAIPQDDASKQKIFKALKEISDAKTRIAAERDLIKEIVSVVSDEHNLPKKYVNKIANIYHKQNFGNVSAENEAVEILYETVVGTN